MKIYKTERCICKMWTYVDGECPDHGINSKWQRELRVLFGPFVDVNIQLGLHSLP